jgi:hypothetical protein
MGAAGRDKACTRGARESRSIASQNQLFDLAFEFGHRSIEGFPPRIDDDGPLWVQPAKVEADRLPDSPFDPVADNRLTQSPRNREADSGAVGLCLANAECREIRTRETRTMIVHAAKILGSQQADTFRKTSD